MKKKRDEDLFVGLVGRTVLVCAMGANTFTGVLKYSSRYELKFLSSEGGKDYTIVIPKHAIISVSTEGEA